MSASRIRAGAVVLLTGTLAFGLNSMFGQVCRNGWVGAVIGIFTSADPNRAVLPGSAIPVLRVYTRFRPLDELLALANIMFWNVVDGSTPQLSLYAIQFGGQLVPIYAAMMIEGLREGNRHRVFFYSVLWGDLMQATGYSTIMPIYAAIHLMTSTAASNSKKAISPAYLAPLDLRAILPAFGFGYILLTCLFAYPFSSGVFRQWTCALWQGFPHKVVLIQYVIAVILQGFGTADLRARHQSWQENYRALSRVYSFAYNIAAAAQMFTFIVLALVAVCPELLPAGVAQALTLGKVFKPGSFHSTQPMESMAAAMHTLFLYDQYSGSTSALIWGVSLYLISKETVTWNECLGLACNVLRWSAVAGPAGALVRLLQRRDQELMLEDYPNDVKKVF
ncbi:hypothetical protein QBC46DRAFT_352834 [Diplogelasinospora grovesii]|uniref:Uncharacterized protein n=1 Tax=Diplogelasinospora grovesii TaxID=303347 RepID=A0AAN6S677_9PEZI|nr:hypothetical protein QBC46DRAFT_352834 [Diplogelasinospora grovesii]